MPDAALPFGGKVAVVTGSMSPIGLACARYLAAQGALTVLHDPDEPGVDRVADELTAGGGTAVAMGGSISEAEGADALIDRVMGRYGHVDIVVSSGRKHLGTDLTTTDCDVIRSVIELDLLGTIWIVRAALRVMQAQTFGRIVTTSSGLGAFGLPHSAPYAAATAGIAGLTRSAALEVASTGIAINAIAPIVDEGPDDPFFRAHPDLDRRRYTAEVVAPVIAFLCHEACQLNGEIVSVGAGRTARILTGYPVGSMNPDADHEEIGRSMGRILSTKYPFFSQNAMDELLLIEV